MNCPTCLGSGIPGWIFVASDDGFYSYRKCPDCIGGVASCCDTAGSAQPEPKTKSALEPENTAPP